MTLVHEAMGAGMQTLRLLGSSLAHVGEPFGGATLHHTGGTFESERAVVLAHGFGAVGAHLSAWRRTSAAAGVAVYEWRYGTLGRDTVGTAHLLAEAMNDLAGRHQQLVVVGHSLGGAVALAATGITGLGDIEVMTVGSPLRDGAWLGHVGVLRELWAIGETVRREMVTTVAGGADLVVPARAALLEGSCQVVIPRAGHLGLLWHPRVLEQISLALEAPVRMKVAS